MSKQKAAPTRARETDDQCRAAIARVRAKLISDHDRLRGNLRTGLALIALLKAKESGEAFELPHKKIMSVIEALHHFFDDADSASEDLRGRIDEVVA